MRRVHRRSFAVNSFMEDDTGEFLDELDTSFFRRVRMKAIFPSQVYTALLIDLCIKSVPTLPSTGHSTQKYSRTKANTLSHLQLHVFI